MLGTLHDVINMHETAHPDAAFVEAGYFNYWNLKDALHLYNQHKRDQQALIRCKAM